MFDNQLRDLYQEVILEHSRTPYHFYPLSAPYQIAIGNNPLCGDKISVYVRPQAGVISALSFQGQGCAICMASASLMIQALEQKTIADFDKLFLHLKQQITKPVSQAQEVKHLGKLQVLLGVREFPMRVKCATLAWHTLNNALKAISTTATTE